MRKAEVFFDAITNIKEELIDAALDYRFTRKRIHWQRYMSTAACLALVTLVGFGAAQLGIFGGSSKSDSSNNMTADTAAPEEGRWDTGSTESVTEDSAANKGSAPGTSGSGSNKAESSVEDQKSEPVEFVKFGATVLEVSDAWILVEPLEGEEILASADRFLVSTADVEEPPELKEGDEILITFDGFIRESYPAQITAVQLKPLLRELGKD